MENNCKSQIKLSLELNNMINYMSNGKATTILLTF